MFQCKVSLGFLSSLEGGVQRTVATHTAFAWPPRGALWNDPLDGASGLREAFFEASSASTAISTTTAALGRQHKALACRRWAAPTSPGAIPLPTRRASSSGDLSARGRKAFVERSALTFSLQNFEPMHAAATPQKPLDGSRLWKVSSEESVDEETCEISI